MERRDFLNYAVRGLGLILGAAVFSPGALYFLSPAWKREKEDWVLLGHLKEISPDQPWKAEFVQRRKDGWMTVEEKKSAWVILKGKEVTVFDPHCTHLGCPYRWDESKQSFLCPCHNAVFDKEGNVLSGPPPRPLDRLEAKIEGEKLWVLPALKKV